MHLALYCFANGQLSTALKLLYRARYLMLMVSGEDHPEMALLDVSLKLIFIQCLIQTQVLCVCIYCCLLLSTLLVMYLLTQVVMGCVTLLEFILYDFNWYLFSILSLVTFCRVTLGWYCME